MMKSLKELLAEHSFFQGLPDEFLELVAGCGKNVKFNAGEYIFQEGDVSDTFYLIRHGRVALEIHVPGRGSVVIETLGEGDLLSWSWLVPPYRKLFDAKALTLVRAFAFDGKCILQKCEEDPKLGYELLKRFVQIVGQRLQATRLRLLDIYGQGQTGKMRP